MELIILTKSAGMKASRIETKTSWKIKPGNVIVQKRKGRGRVTSFEI